MACVNSISLAFCQKNDVVWAFGYPENDSIHRQGGTYLKFTDPNLLNVSFFHIPFSLSGGAFYSTNEGRLLMATNGCEIAGPDFKLIPDDQGINAGDIKDSFCDREYPVWQGMIFIPIDSNPDSTHVRLLHMWMNDNAVISELRYTDASHVESSDTLIIQKRDITVDSQGYFGNLSCTRHANGRDWWILLPELNSNRIFKYLSTPQGVREFGSQTIGDIWDDTYWGGQTAFSPDGSIYVRANPFNGVQIYNFDRCSGELLAALTLPLEGLPLTSCGAAFSRAGRYLYISTSTKVYQYDILSANIKESEVLVAEYDGFVGPLWTTFFQLMLAPDGRIYGTATNTVHYLHVIDRPDESGLKCEFIQHGLELPTLSGWSIPNFPNYRLSALDGSPCDTLGIDNIPVAEWRREVDDSTDLMTIRFTDLSFFNPETWHWDFGDGFTSIEQHPVHPYAEPGLYHVCLTVSNENASDSTCYWVEIDETSTATVDIPEVPALKVSPNPFSDQIRISYGDDTSVRWYQVRLVDMYGRVIYDQQMPVPSVVYLDQLAAGSYGVVLIGEDGSVLDSEVVVKQ